MTGLQLPRETLLEAYRLMRTIRAFEDRVNLEMTTGDVPGNTHLYAGQEASAVGICLHLSETDRIASTHRGHGHCIAKGCDIGAMMAEIFGRPGSTEDVFAILSAISILHDCCELSFSSDTAATGWEGMCSWLAKVPSRFDAMLEARDVAALTVLAHWAGILVRRVELVGCWLLQGMSESLISQCLGHLSEKIPYAECLIIEVL